MIYIQFPPDGTSNNGMLKQQVVYLNINLNLKNSKKPFSVRFNSQTQTPLKKLLLQHGNMLPVMIAQYNQPLPIKKVTPSNMGDSP